MEFKTTTNYQDFIKEYNEIVKDAYRIDDTVSLIKSWIEKEIQTHYCNNGSKSVDYEIKSWDTKLGYTQSITVLVEIDCTCTIDDTCCECKEYITY